MVLIILLLISIILQLIATSIVLRLLRVTKFNASWILFTIALVIMVVMRFDELILAIGEKYNLSYTLNMPQDVYAWLGVASSLCLAVGIFIVKKILDYMATREAQRRRYEKRILNAVIEAEERQKQKFSKELHDGLGPLLSTAKMSVSALSSRNSNPEINKEIIANAEQAINLAINSVRDISNNLSPHILNNFGVSRALNTFINRLKTVSQTEIIYRNNLRNQRFDINREVIVYRVVCELINNSLKHAEASVITLDLHFENEMLKIRYTDNGIGFNTEAPTDGMGLSNINSRISSIKGEITISSAIGQGMQVDIELFLKETVV